VGLLVVIVGVLAPLLAIALAHRGTAPPGRGPAADKGGQIIAGEAAVRGQATSWITSQVGRDVVVACDAVMCSDLAQHGFPAGNLNVLQPTAPNPYGSGLVVATAGIRSQFGSKLASFFAPTVIASFGTGQDRIDVRVIAASGAVAYSAALDKDLQARRSSGAVLAASRRITSAGAVRAQLTSGQVDMRLLTTIAFLSSQEPVHIIGFAGSAPGAGPGVPLRWVYLAATDAGPGARRAGYLQSLIAFSRALRPPYVPLSVQTVRLPGGIAALRIEFAAPSPLGLLKS
jgi:hypothetical protein